MKSKTIYLWFAGVLILLLAGCSSSVDASKSRSRGVIESGGIVPAEELRVAEYVGYYKQNFPAPVGTTLGLDTRLGNRQVPAEGGAAWLQIGIQARAESNEIIAPLNLAIVIDCSGSMSAAEKMPYVKESLRVFLHSLAANDIVSLVIFSDNAEVVTAATKVGNGEWIEAAVNRLQPYGSTNFNAGLTLAYKEVERNFDVRRNNRVIALTDGIANVGMTDPNQIASTVRAYGERGIYTSIVGLGRDFNDGLLSTMANRGNAAYHFIDSAAEMDKVFRREAAGLFQKAASQVSAVIRPEPTVRILSLTGYEGRPPAGPVKVQLRDMGTGDSQVVLADLEVASGPAGRRTLATVELCYRDLFSNREEIISQAVVADAARLVAYDPTWDVEVLRNLTIQRTAEGLKEIDRLYKAGRYEEAWQLARGLEQALRAAARLTNDAQLIQDAEMMRKYQDTLSQWVQRQTGRPPQWTDGSPNSLPSHGRDPVPAPTASVLEIK